VKVLVSIVTFNSEKYISQLIQDIKEKVAYRNYLISIRDNGSTDKTKEILSSLASPSVHTHFGENIGFGSAHNCNFKAYKDTDLYIILNPDVKIESDFITEIVGFLPFDIASPNILNTNETLQKNGYNHCTPLKIATYEFLLGKHWSKWLHSIVETQRAATNDWKRRPVQWVSGCCVALTNEVIKKTGGFDENIFLYGEDEEFCWRAKKADLQVERINCCKIIHHLGWHNNWKNPTTRKIMFDSTKYVYNKTNSEKPVRRLLLQIFNWMRFKKYELLFPK
jgi:GT2 family glycosyltransferase